MATQTAREAIKPLESTCIAFLIILPLFFFIRYYSRLWYKRAPLGWDDVFVVLSFIASTSACGFGLAIAAVEKEGNTSADHLYGVGPEPLEPQLRKILIYIYCISQALYAGFTTPKLSLIALYLRIFPGKRFRLICKSVAVFLILTWLSFMLGALFACQPVHYFWDRTIKGKCIDADEFYRAINIVNLVEDIFVLILPLRMIYTLQAPLARKAGYSAIFLISGAGTGMSIGRCIQFFRFTGRVIKPIYSANLLPWVVAEPAVYCIACCAAGAAPLFRDSLERIRSTVGKTSAASRKQGLVTSPPEEGFAKLGETMSEDSRAISRGQLASNEVAMVRTVCVEAERKRGGDAYEMVEHPAFG